MESRALMATTKRKEKTMATSTSTQEQTNTGSSSDVSGMADSAKQAAGQAKEAASHVIDQAKEQAASRVDQQRQTLASGLGAVAQAFNSMGNRLRNQDEGPVAQYAAEMGQAVGGQVDRLSKYLQGRNLQELVTDVESFARRSPGAFLGSAFVLGLAASRFLKSSRPAPDPSSTNITDPSHLLPPASSQAQNAPLGALPSSDAPVTTPPSGSTSGTTSNPTSSSGPSTSGAAGVSVSGSSDNPSSTVQS